MAEHRIHWTSPEQLWSRPDVAAEAGVERPYEQPAILRFTTDTFMDDFLAMLEKDPEQLPSLLAQSETWHGPLKPSTDVTGSGPALKTPKLVRKLERLRRAAEHSKSGLSVSTGMSGGESDNSGSAEVIKLYQPAHQRFYLVSACLVCGMTGMPDREVEPARDERVSFVIRRMLPTGKSNLNKPLPDFKASTWEECAYVVSPNGAGWKRIGDISNPDVETLITGEEPLPLFAINYDTDDNRSRRLFSGLIPVGRREAYMAAGTIITEDGVHSAEHLLPKTSRMILFRSQVAEPWKNIIDRAERFKKTTDPSLVEGFTAETRPDPHVVDPTVKAAREQIQIQSWLILLDFAKFLSRHIPNVWGAKSPSNGGDRPKAEEDALLTALKEVKSTTGSSGIGKALAAKWIDKDGNEVSSPYLETDVKDTLFDALKAIAGEEDKLEAARASYDRGKRDGSWPDFLFPLADPLVTALTFPSSMPSLDELDEVDAGIKTVSTDSTDVQTAKEKVDGIMALVVQAMPTEAVESAPPVPLAARPIEDTREGVFVIRAVFERPNCGPLKPTVVSERSRPFQMAGFFDPDAPARPIRIALPIDTSPAGLRKFDKNAAFMISDILCGQLKRAKGLTFGDLVLSVLPWPFHKDLPVPDTGPCTTTVNEEIGTICTLSIPIITICALILLTIIVSLLDIIFKWIPYFTVCFPLPGFKARKEG